MGDSSHELKSSSSDLKSNTKRKSVPEVGTETLEGTEGDAFIISHVECPVTEELRNQIPKSSSGNRDLVTAARGFHLSFYSGLIISTLERAAYKWGISVARHPKRTILCCLALTLLSGFGLLRFQYESDPTKLWIPQESNFIRDTNWMKQKFPEQLRHNVVIYSSENVLSPEALREVYELYSSITKIRVGNYSWEDFCVKIPRVNSLPAAAQLGSDISPMALIKEEILTMKQYCKMLRILPKICLVRSILEFWNYDLDRHLPSNFTWIDVANDFKGEEFSLSPYYGLDTNYSMYLGGVTRDAEGNIISAASTILHFINEKPVGYQGEFDHLAASRFEQQGGIKDEGDSANRLWEQEFLAVVRKFKSRIGATVTFRAERSFSDLSNVAIINDVPFVMVSCMLMYAFVCLNLGKCDVIEMRVYLSIAGLLSIFMAFFVSLGICSAFGVLYSPVHNLLVLLLQGLGVDDMFVLMKMWNHLSSHGIAFCDGSELLPLHRRVGIVMKHAGISITVTSLTDFAAFVIGGFTVVVICLGLAFVTLGAYGVSQMRQHFEIAWFLPDESYLKDFLKDINDYFPAIGKRGFIVYGRMNHSGLVHDLRNLDEKFGGQTFVTSVDSWSQSFLDWMETFYPSEQMNDFTFAERFSQFLFMPSGAPYARNFVFNGTLTCGEPVPEILVSRTEYTMREVPTSNARVETMLELRAIVDNSGITATKSFPWSFEFSSWETDRFISGELIRNMLLASACVFFVTVLLIANIHASFWVLVCVAMTLISTTGLIHFWGLTIEIVSSLNLILAVGLCVDYAAHIGHAFMTCDGTRNERAEETLSKIGPAVLSGGFSTFLSLSVLYFSGSYVFMVFFKVFVATCIFGLYYGLLFLPVVLSLCGPPPYFAEVSCNDREDKGLGETKESKYNPAEEAHGHEDIL
ncbi:unnamed protein product [Notodromas monacha]|uniref:SSD domain-containing protein n=1 Tax=Notodromas monacha TaxID=399045 RepID=A0A7R9BNW9_9CRUS|nr:unnamed protein product [Notodromas monacha]CAG0918990.1 unnamed protein product [Notodromas monacha]